MQHLIFLLEDSFTSLVHIVATCIEFLAVFIIIVAVLKNLYNLLFIEKFDFELSQKDPVLNSGLNTALELFLAGEILNTIVADDFEKLAHVGALVLIRIVIALLVHWEREQKDKHELENIVKNLETKKKL